MNDQKPEGVIKSNSIYIVLLLVVFLFGLSITGWQWRHTAGDLTKTQSELATAERMLRRSEIKGILTAALIDADRQIYSRALQGTSRFFAELASEIDRDDRSVYRIEERINLKPIFEYREGVIATMAKNQVSSVERLANIYALFLKATEATGQNLRPLEVKKEDSNSNSNGGNQNVASGNVNNEKTGNENVGGANVNNSNTQTNRNSGNQNRSDNTPADDSKTPKEPSNNNTASKIL